MRKCGLSRECNGRSGWRKISPARRYDVAGGLERPGRRCYRLWLSQDALQGRRGGYTTYFDGQFRADSASRVHIRLDQLKQPVTFYLDNIRFRPCEDV